MGKTWFLKVAPDTHYLPVHALRDARPGISASSWAVGPAAISIYLYFFYYIFFHLNLSSIYTDVSLFTFMY